MFGVNGWEIVLLALITVFILGPDRMPEYAAKLARGIRRLRVMAEGAKGQLKDQLGPEYEDINWRQYDPRQYDPRRIVKEALLDPLDDAVSPVRDEIGSMRSAGSIRAVPPSPLPVAQPWRARPRPTLQALRSTSRRRASSTQWDPSRPTPYDVDAT